MQSISTISAFICFQLYVLRTASTEARATGRVCASVRKDMPRRGAPVSPKSPKSLPQIHNSHKFQINPSQLRAASDASTVVFAMDSARATARMASTGHNVSSGTRVQPS